MVGSFGRCSGRSMTHTGLAAVVWLLLATAFRPAQAQAPGSGVAPVRAQAVQPGIGFGGSVGLNTFGGTANRVIADAVGYEVFVAGGTRAGLFARAGATFGGHDIGQRVAPWKFVAVFVEPRWVFADVSPTWAPFIAGRAGRAWERVIGRNYSFNGSGTLLAGGAGALVRMAPQIALEAGVMYGRASFGRYTFRGEFAWKTCLDGLEAGTGLPESLAECAGSRGLGGAVRLCYPPYFTTETSNCTPPDIPYENTDRDGSWLRTWLGVRLSLAAPG